MSALSTVNISTVREIRPSHVDALKRLGLLTVGAVSTASPHEISTRMNIPLDEAAEIVDCCDRMCRKNIGSSSSSASFSADHQTNNNNNILSQIKPLSQMCKEYADNTQRRPTCCPPIDRLLDGGFRHSSISEVFGLPGAGKSQLAMQLAAAATLPHFFGGLPSDSAPILVIDTEGSWTTERVQEFCSEFSKRMHASTTALKHTGVEVDDEVARQIADYSVEDAVSRIQFVRAADTATVAAALYLFRDSAMKTLRVAEGELAAIAEEEEEEQQNRKAENEDGAATSNCEVTEEEQQQQDEQHQRQHHIASLKAAANAGGLIILDSVAALFKESRVGLDGGNNMCFSNRASLDGGSGGSGSGNSSALSKAQGVSALARLLLSLADQTRAAVVVTNQMVRQWEDRGSAAAGGISNNNRNQSFSSGTKYTPALGDVWASVPLVRLELRRLPGTAFTSASRMCRVLRDWDWPSALFFGGGGVGGDDADAPICIDPADEADRGRQQEEGDDENDNRNNNTSWQSLLPSKPKQGVFRIGKTLEAPVSSANNNNNPNSPCDSGEPTTNKSPNSIISANQQNIALGTDSAAAVAATKPTAKTTWADLNNNNNNNNNNNKMGDTSIVSTGAAATAAAAGHVPLRRERASDETEAERQPQETAVLISEGKKNDDVAAQHVLVSSSSLMSSVNSSDNNNKNVNNSSSTLVAAPEDDGDDDDFFLSKRNRSSKTHVSRR